MSLLKRFAARLPVSWQNELRRWHFRTQIARNRFESDEPEYHRLHEWVAPGDWVVDVGANVGHFTKRLSDLVGQDGRVIAFEPIAATFSILAANVRSFRFENVTLCNLAASDSVGLARFSMPRFHSGLPNYYQASMTASQEDGTIQAASLIMPLDHLVQGQRVSLVKVDAEDHELEVLKGLSGVLAASRPTLIVEGTSDRVAEFLDGFGYVRTRNPNSPNVVFESMHTPRPANV